MAQLEVAHDIPSRAAPRVAASVARLRSWEIGLLGILNICLGLGSTWDVKWHYAVGRDSFWIPPHLMLYSAVTLIGLICAGGVLYETWLSRTAGGVASQEPTAHILGFSGPLGLFIAGCGIVVMLLAAPFDDWWHRMYGIDVTIWSPPHMLGVFGGAVAAFGSLVMAAQERSAHAGRWLTFAVLLFLMGLISTGSFSLIPAAKLSFWPHAFSPAKEPFDNNLLFFPLLGSLLLTYPFAAAARLFEGRRAWLAPLAVLGLFVLLNVLQYVTARAGFAALIPWGDQQFVRSPVGVERSLWYHPILMALPTAVLALIVAVNKGRLSGRAFWLAGAAFGLALMLCGLLVFVLNNPQDQLDLATVALGLVLAPAFGALSAAVGAALGRWLARPAA